ncbi:MAG: alpha-galactosidase [Tenericutes bacterium]|nr:alpha-galactosidase [Mycoplasmatota bacterium]
MIYIDKEKLLFHLQTENTSYVIKVLPSKHLGQVYYGEILDINNEINDLKPKHNIEVGSQVIYQEEDKTFNLNLAFLEMPTYGKGDFREPMLHLRLKDGSRTSDFLYLKHEVISKPIFDEMPETKANKTEVETLVITLRDDLLNIEVDLHYSVFPTVDVITRRAVIRNESSEPIILEKALSMNFDSFSDDYQLTTFEGAWIRERMINKRKVIQGITKIDSKKGVSSADHNPFVVISENEANEKYGKCFGFALVYSGNFEVVIERSPFDILRVQMGINSFDFYWELKQSEQFVTPEVVMSFSNTGLNQLSKNYHELINNHIIKPDWAKKERPVLFNNWEATMFDFSQKKLLKLAKSAKKLGIELFVLDDGWFGKRNSDTAGLGDWFVNKKKLPLGINKLAEKINKIGMDFGIWVEPEMVNMDSDLYRAHPEWAIKHDNRKPSFGRNQLILDLTKAEVKDYLVKVLSDLIESANIKYIKWDMNRSFSDIYSNSLDSANQGKLVHLYQLGLYNILERLTTKFPTVLFESCASGGNRFDMAMLYYMPQVWTSDNTDAYCRQLIQYGTSYGYPQSVMGAHVSDSPSAQVIRRTPLETRFDVAAFGLLGYEFDSSSLSTFEKKVIKNQITFYKEHRKLLQFGEYHRIKNPFETNNMYIAVTSKDKKECILGVYKTLEQPNGSHEVIDMFMLDKNYTYQVDNRKAYFNLSKFGYLVKHALPIKLNHNGILFHILSNNYLYEMEQDHQVLGGDQLVNNGFIPKQNFMGSGINESVRLMGDFGSRLYYFKALEDKNEKSN